MLLSVRGRPLICERLFALVKWPNLWFVCVFMAVFFVWTVSATSFWDQQYDLCTYMQTHACMLQLLELFLTLFAVKQCHVCELVLAAWWDSRSEGMIKWRKERFILITCFFCLGMLMIDMTFFPRRPRVALCLLVGVCARRQWCC